MHFTMSRLRTLALSLTLTALSAEAASDWITPTVRAPRVEQRFFESAAAKTKVSFFIYKPALVDGFGEANGEFYRGAYPGGWAVSESKFRLGGRAGERPASMER